MEDAAVLAKLTPAERLQSALDLSDFCLMLAAKTREARLNEALRKIVKALDGGESMYQKLNWSMRSIKL